jgi:hypothetical protein
MIIDKEQSPVNLLLLINVPLVRVHKINYLGQSLIDNWDHSHEIKCRIEKTRVAFMKMKNLFCSHQLSINLRIRMVRCYVFTVEIWTLSKVSINRIQVFEMWIYRRILKLVGAIT